MSTETAAPKQQTSKTAVVAGFIGNVLEWFDYGIYGYFAVAISHNFFVSDNEIVALLLTFMVFGLGFVVRPIGAFIFGHLGDRLGRKDTLSITVILMGGCTFIMGCLPNYAQIGVAAPIILTIVRLGQGIACGGEWGSAVSFLGEYARKDNRAFIISFSQMGTAIGLLCGASLGMLFSNVMSQEALMGWGWRIPFLFGIVIAAVGYYIRKGVDETPVFKEMEVLANPIKVAFKTHGTTIVKQFFLAGAAHITYWLIFSYMVTYVNVFLKLPLQAGFSLSAIILLTYIVVLPFNGMLADKIGRKPMMIIGGTGLCVFAYPLYSILANASTFGAMALVGIALATMFALWNGSVTCLMNELYPAKIRVTAFSLAYQFSSAVFAGTALMIATWLVDKTGNVMAMPMYIIAAQAMGLIMIVFFIKETMHLNYERDE
jgi:MHS family proline/betaine transporter-like MFS transporter